MRIEFPRDQIRIVLDLTPGGWRKAPNGAPHPPGSPPYSAQALARAVEALLADTLAGPHRVVISAFELQVEISFPVDDAPTVEAIAAERKRLAEIVERCRYAPANGEGRDGRLETQP